MWPLPTITQAQLSAAWSILVPGEVNELISGEVLWQCLAKLKNSPYSLIQYILHYEFTPRVLLQNLLRCLYQVNHDGKGNRNMG